LNVKELRSGSTLTLVVVLLWRQVLQFFTFMGMPHPYKAPLLLVEGPVLEDYAGQG
jgi:hypothetical protein